VVVQRAGMIVGSSTMSDNSEQRFFGPTGQMFVSTRFVSFDERFSVLHGRDDPSVIPVSSLVKGQLTTATKHRVLLTPYRWTEGQVVRVLSMGLDSKKAAAWWWKQNCGC